MLLRSVVALFPLLMVAVRGDVVSYPLPEIYDKSDYFELKVDGKSIHTVRYAEYDYAHLSMDEGEATEFRIKALDEGEITSYSISPKGLSIDAEVDGDELVFTLHDAYYLIIKINEVREFIVLADPSETDVPDPDGRGVYNVLDYDADNTGSSVTKGVQDALDAAAKHPGSIVYVPHGLYLIGNLMLRDKTSLYLAGGAVLRFTGNPDDYKTMFTKSDLYPGTWWIQTEFDSSDIKVYGRGTLDGNGANTRKNDYIASILVPAGTKDFECDGILVRDSSFWAVTPIQVEDATLTSLKVLNRHDVTQDDGIDVVESKRVTVKRTIAVSNDDAFSAKTWPYKTGTTVPYPYPPRDQKDVTFDDCFAWTLCFGYKIGQGVYQTQDSVKFKNSAAYSAGVGMGIHHLFGNSSSKNIVFENIEVERLRGSPGGFSSWLVVIVQEKDDRGVGPIEDVTVKDIRARDQGHARGYIQGYSEDIMVSGVTLSDVYMYTNSTPAKTLKEMNILNTSYSEDIKIRNGMLSGL